MDTAVRSPIDIPMMPTPSTSSASPSVELRHDYEVLSSNTTDLSSAHTSPDDFRNSPVKECDVLLNSHDLPKSNIADSLSKAVTATRKQQQRSCTAVVYESQISPELEGIKLKIKKSPTQEVTKKRQQKQKPSEAIVRKRAAKALAPAKTPKPRKPRQTPPAAWGKGKKRKRKKKGQSEDEGTDEDDFEDEDFYNYNGEPADTAEDDSKREQSIWANHRMPPNILARIFMEVTYTEGCIPTLARLSRVSRLWWQVSTTPQLWHTLDLGPSRVNEKHKTERMLFWLLENRLSHAQDLALGGWTSALSRAALESISTTCTELRGLNLSGCKGLLGENLMTIVQNCNSLQRLDLSGVSEFSINPKGALNSSILCEVAKLLGSRLTHLNLANNFTTGIQQIVAALAVSCPSLQLLDLSNLRTTTRDTVCINIEQLQQGCPLLRVLRFTNSLIRLQATPLKDQAASTGFPQMEELSIAVDPKSSYTSLDNASIERILKNAHKLRLLDVRGCTSISNSSLVRVPAWDLEHLFLSGCSATRHSADGLELVIRKWRHSLIEVDLSWMAVTEALDQAVMVLSEESESPLKVLDLCGSSVSFAPVRQVLLNCTQLRWLNLSSCRALPRGIKRLYDGVTLLKTLREAIQQGKYDDNEQQQDD